MSSLKIIDENLLKSTYEIDFFSSQLIEIIFEKLLGKYDFPRQR